VQKALNAGCNDYISKPARSQVLLEMVSKHLSNHKNESPPGAEPVADTSTMMEVKPIRE